MKIQEKGNTEIKEVQRKIQYIKSRFGESDEPLLSALEEHGIQLPVKEMPVFQLKSYLSEKEWKVWQNMSDVRKKQILRQVTQTGDYRRLADSIQKSMVGMGIWNKQNEWTNGGTTHEKKKTEYHSQRTQNVQGIYEETEGNTSDVDANTTFQAKSGIAQMGDSVMQTGEGTFETPASKTGITLASDVTSGGSVELVKVGARVVKKTAKTISNSIQASEHEKHRSVQGLFTQNETTVGNSLGNVSGLQNFIMATAAIVGTIAQVVLLPLLIMLLIPILIVTAIFTLITTIVTATSGGGMGDSSYLQWAEEIAADDSHGYSNGHAYGYETGRLGPDYDCSSFVCTALRNAGYPLSGGETTGTMPAALVAAGFEQLPYTGQADLLPGDILLVHETDPVNGRQHTEFYYGNGQVVGATGDLDGKKAGDQSGSGGEIRVGAFYEDGWQYVFRSENGYANEGEIEIPETYEGYEVGRIYTCTPHYGTWNWAYTQREVFNKWVEAGSVYSENVAMIDDKYLIACADTFGRVGDYVTFYLDDGTALDCIIADQKSRSDPNFTIYGHIHGNAIDVIEAETDATINPGSAGCVPSWGGHRVVSCTNHGSVL